MPFLYQSSLVETPINLDEVLALNKDGFDKTHLYLTLNATDEHGATREVEEKIPLFAVENLSLKDYHLTWQFRNYSKLSIDVELEVTNDRAEVVYRGDSRSVGFKDSFIQMSDDINISRNGNFYYRLRLSCPDDGLNEYYPSREGVLFAVSKDLREISQTTIDGDFRNVSKFLMDNIPDGTVADPAYVKKLIDIICNPGISETYRITSGTRDKHLVTSKFDSYGQEASFGLNGDKFHFTLKEFEQYIAKKNVLNSYVDGKKIFPRDNNTQSKMDGISHSYLKESDIPENGTIEIESMTNHLIDSEKFVCKYLIQNQKDMHDIYNDGIQIAASNIGSYFSHRDLSVFVRFKNSSSWKRVNPKRAKITIHFSDDLRFSVNVKIMDSYVSKIGNEIMVVSNNITSAMYFKTEAFNKLANYYQVPCYFVPVTHVTEQGEVVTEFITEIDNVEVYVNGYRLIPDVDFALVNLELHEQIPSMILFKDMTHFGSKIEVIYRDHMENSYFFISEIEKRDDDRAVITLGENCPPFIKGTFTVFANNKKLHSGQYDIINYRSIILKDVDTRKNIMVKFYHEDDELLRRLLDIYSRNRSPEDKEADRIGQANYVNNWIGKNQTEAIEEKDDDAYLGLKYVHQLDDSYKYFDQLYDMVKSDVSIDLDASNRNLFTGLKSSPVVMDFMKSLPVYFNHHIYLNANRSYGVHQFEDNVSLFNPGRSYLIHKYVDEKLKQDEDPDINCGEVGSVEFLTYLNENMGLILPYLNNNILIDCNAPLDKENYKGLK
jgi:hypothetical protein